MNFLLGNSWGLRREFLMLRRGCLRHAPMFSLPRWCSVAVSIPCADVGALSCLGPPMGTDRWCGLGVGCRAGTGRLSPHQRLRTYTSFVRQTKIAHPKQGCGHASPIALHYAYIRHVSALTLYGHCSLSLQSIAGHYIRAGTGDTHCEELHSVSA